MGNATLSVFDNVELYKQAALAILNQDITLNTVCLSELELLKPDAPDAFMAICKCTCQAEECAVFSAGACSASATNSRLLVSSQLCLDMAQLVAERMEQLPCSSITTARQAAEHILSCSSLQLRFKMNLMALKFQKTAATAAPAAAIGYSCATAAAPAAAPAVAWLHLRALSRESAKDVKFIMSWSSDFLQEAMKLPALPSDSQVGPMVHPWLQHGQYMIAEAPNASASDASTKHSAFDTTAAAATWRHQTSGDAAAADVAAAPAVDAAAGAGAMQPVCLLCHVPTGSTSSRIVLVYTPVMHRSHGYARSAVRLLCSVLTQQQYQHICLMASQDNPTANRVYQDAGFVNVGEIHIIAKPDQALW